ncbi:hypothetical protein RJ639_005869 [Escallonia herrerae]|uniref:protein-disulfide reductase n=1 Tax=Escallonia herrerae TaxID=1293975 RepID=A0AA88VW56_9ASTE|nr:hypothetical protein RJ639_005869 [Escallonia herrerae]
MRQEDGVKGLDSEAEMVSNSKYMSLLASEGREFLFSPTGSQVRISDLQGKVLGIYFSANWYPPCQSFTQLLVDVYEQIKRTCSNFEIVFVSSDEDLDAFNKYHACMPWPAIPFPDLETKKALNRRFEVEGIPCLIILQPNSNGDDTVLHDGAELVPIASLMGKTIGLYFSAQWCLPGVKFTPKLISIYHKIKETLKQDGTIEDFEIILVSSDHDQVEFDSYFSTVPWLALPFGDPAIKYVTKYFDVRGIPSLVILGPDGKTVTEQGRNLINLYRQNAYPFTKARVELIEKQMDEEAKSFPASEFHSGHRHELTLVSQGSGGGPFICCDCDEQGAGWAYQCIECGYEVHPKCVRVVNRGSMIER